MSDDHHDIHHRIDSLQQDIASIGTTLGEGLSKLTSAVEKLVVLETEHKSTRETLARYGEKLEKHDSRLDDIEKRVPIYDLFVNSAKRIAMIAGGFLIVGIMGGLITFT